MRVTQGPDFGRGTVRAGLFTLGAIAAITTITLPEGARGIRIRPQAEGHVVFALGEDPEALGADEFTTGNVAVYGEPEPRTFYPITAGDTRDLRLLSDAADMPVIVEVF